MEKKMNTVGLSHLLFHLQRSKRSFYALISLLLLFLLAYNSISIYCTHIPTIPVKVSPQNVAGKSRKSFFKPSSAKMSSSGVLSSVQNGESSPNLRTHLPLLHNNRILAVSSNRTTEHHHPKRKKKSRRDIKSEANQFENRVLEFFEGSSSDFSCKFRFFMTWISSLESFGDRELFAVSSLFKTHPRGCLVIASDSLDSGNGLQILRSFSEKGFKVTAISPDYNYLFKGTPAESWYNQLMQGNVQPGVVPLGQNLSNLLRLGLLYRFGGIYLDSDVIVIRSFKHLKNSIGAQSVDLETGNWSRLNNAVMVFDKGHPLLFKFIQEFALTFDGNKWGHNGPYLVSRVVARVTGRPGFNFTVLLPMAFYPVDWSRIKSLFEGPKSLNHTKWLLAKLKQIRSKCFAVHLWNKHSRGLEIEKGSIIQHIVSSSGAFCKSCDKVHID